MDSKITDHQAVHIELTCSKPHPPRKMVTCINIMKINIDSSKQDICSSDILTNHGVNVEERIQRYNDILYNHLEKYVPQHMKKVADKGEDLREDGEIHH